MLPSWIQGRPPNWLGEMVARKKEEPRAIARNQERRIEQRLALVHEIQKLRETGEPRTSVMRRLANVAGISARTAYRDVAAFERHGDLGLARKLPSNAGEPRVFVSRQFDREVGDTDTLRELSRELDTVLKSLWKSSLSAGGAKKIGVLASRWLSEQCGRLNLTASEAALWIPLHRVRRFRDYRIVHQRRSDRKAFNDGAPRVRLDYTGLSPAEIVVGDVKHLDVLVQRADGTTGYPKMVAFEDGATGRVFARIFLLPAGEQVRREHVSQTFIEMVEDPSWGAPTCLRIDRGSEFAAFQHLREVFAALNRQGLTGVFRTRPYSPQSKSIEGWFGRFDEWGISALPGYVGPDRLNQKVQTMGRPTRPFPGGLAGFERTVGELVDAYANWPIGGGRNDRSPNDIFTDHVQAGWQPQLVDKTVLDAAFRQTKIGRVDRGKIKIKREHYYHPSLDSLVHGTKVEIAHPWRRDDVPFFRVIGTAVWERLEREQGFHPLDLAGAAEASRRRAAYSRAVSRRDQEVPTIDPVAMLTSGSATASPAAPTGSRRQVDWGERLEALSRAVGGSSPQAVPENLSMRRARNERMNRLLQIDGPVTAKLMAKESAS